MAEPGGAWAGYERGSSGYRRVLLALLCAGVATFAQLYSVQGVLPLMARELDLDAATLGLAAAVLPWSVVSDRWGRRRTMAVAAAAATPCLTGGDPHRQRPRGGCGRGVRIHRAAAAWVHGPDRAAHRSGRPCRVAARQSCRPRAGRAVPAGFLLMGGFVALYR